MNIEKVKHIAISIKGVDEFYKESKLLKEDMTFFKLYTDRNRKSDFRFVLIPCQNGAYKAFRDIFEAYSLSDTFLEDAFAVYTVMKEYPVTDHGHINVYKSKGGTLLRR